MPDIDLNWADEALNSGTQSTSTATVYPDEIDTQWASEVVAEEDTKLYQTNANLNNIAKAAGKPNGSSAVPHTNKRHTDMVDSNDHLLKNFIAMSDAVKGDSPMLNGTLMGDVGVLAKTGANGLLKLGIGLVNIADDVLDTVGLSLLSDQERVQIEKDRQIIQQNLTGTKVGEKSGFWSRETLGDAIVMAAMPTNIAGKLPMLSTGSAKLMAKMGATEYVIRKGENVSSGTAAEDALISAIGGRLLHYGLTTTLPAIGKALADRKYNITFNNMMRTLNPEFKDYKSTDAWLKSPEWANLSKSWKEVTGRTPNTPQERMLAAMFGTPTGRSMLGEVYRLDSLSSASVLDNMTDKLMQQMFDRLSKTDGLDTEALQTAFNHDDLARYIMKELKGLTDPKAVNKTPTSGLVQVARDTWGMFEKGLKFKYSDQQLVTGKDELLGDLGSAIEDSLKTVGMASKADAVESATLMNISKILNRMSPDDSNVITLKLGDLMSLRKELNGLSDEVTSPVIKQAKSRIDKYMEAFLDEEDLVGYKQLNDMYRRHTITSEADLVKALNSKMSDKDIYNLLAQVYSKTDYAQTDAITQLLAPQTRELFDRAVLRGMFQKASMTPDGLDSVLLPNFEMLERIYGSSALPKTEVGKVMGDYVKSLSDLFGTGINRGKAKLKGDASAVTTEIWRGVTNAFYKHIVPYTHRGRELRTLSDTIKVLTNHPEEVKSVFSDIAMPHYGTVKGYAKFTDEIKALQTHAQLLSETLITPKTSEQIEKVLDGGDPADLPPAVFAVHADNYGKTMQHLSGKLSEWMEKAINYSAQPPVQNEFVKLSYNIKPSATRTMVAGGVPRVVIPDAQFTLKQTGAALETQVNKAPISLSDIVGLNRELTDVYPNLKDLKVEFTSTPSGGSTSFKDGIITIDLHDEAIAAAKGAAKTTQVKKRIIEGIRHAIDAEEGVVRSYSPIWHTHILNSETGVSSTGQAVLHEFFRSKQAPACIDAVVKGNTGEQHAILTKLLKDSGMREADAATSASKVLDNLSAVLNTDSGYNYMWRYVHGQKEFSILDSLAKQVQKQSDGKVTITPYDMRRIIQEDGYPDLNTIWDYIPNVQGDTL